LAVLDGWAEAGGLEPAGRRPGRATAAVLVDFLELVLRFREVFFDDVPAELFLPEADLFLVTLLPMPFRVDEALPACWVPLLPGFPLPGFAADRLLDLPAADFLDVAFLEAAFFFGIR
jgi:hypothetical protein